MRCSLCEATKCKGKRKHTCVHEHALNEEIAVENGSEFMLRAKGERRGVCVCVCACL